MNHLGAIKSIRFVPASAFVSKDPLKAITRSDIQGLPWQLLDTVSGTASFHQESEVKSGGTVYPTTIGCEVAGMDTYLDLLPGRHYILYITDMNGNEMTVGRKSVPLQLLINGKIPKSATSRPGFSLTFQGKLFLPAEIL